MDDFRLFLLDGMALVYRAHFAFAVRPIMTSYGMNTSALLGFTNTLTDLIRKESPTHLAVVFDTAAPTARHERFPAYKAQREAMPEDLSIAIPHVKRLLAAFHVPVLELDGYEADDIIGTLARQVQGEGAGVTFMVTPDKDFAQLVDDRTWMWKPGRQGNDHEVIGVPEVQTQWLVERPEQVIDVLGLMGDSVDNIPGVPGIGEKTGKALIQKFGSVEGVLASLDQLKGKQKENLTTFAEQARLSRELATIQLDVPIPVRLDDLRRQPMDEDAVKALLSEFEFNAVGRRLFGDDFKAGRGFDRRAAEAAGEESGQMELPAVIRTAADTPHQWQTAAGLKKCQDAVKSLLKQDLLGIAVDLDGPDPREAAIRGIAFSAKTHEAVYLTGASSADLVSAVQPLLEKADLVLAGHDLKESIQALRLAGATVKATLFDTMVAAALIDPDQRQSLEWLSESLLGYALTKDKPAGDGGQMLMELGSEPAVQADPVFERADVARQLVPLLKPKLSDRGQDRVFYQIESPLISVLAGMEAAGIRLEPAVLREASVRLEKEIRELEESVQEKAGTRFNVSSPKQLGEILFDRLKLVAKPKKTKTGQYLTNEDTLAELAVDHPIVADLLAFREASKLKSTYVDALPGAVSRRTGRIHTTFHQVSTATGRLASNNPNLQNIPIRTEQGRAIRKAFVAPGPEWTLLSADYSQIELRVMAALSADPHMIEAFQQGLDIHTATAARVHNVPLDGVTSDMRRTAKMVNFGIIYGISAFGLAQRLGIARSEGARLIDEYFVQYPGIKRFMDDTVAEAGKRGYVETITGRRRYLRDINSRNGMVRKAAERTAINTPIQGSAADMIKIAMVNIDRFLTEEKCRTRMILQVHDELVFEVPDDEREAMRARLPGLMQDALKLTVPVLVELGEGKDWFEAHA